MKKTEMMCQQYLLKVSLLSVCLSQCLELLVFSVWREALAVRCFKKALPPSLKDASISRQQWQLKVIPTPTILLFQRSLPLIGAQHIPPWQLLPCLSSATPPGSKSWEAEVLLLLKAEQYPDNVWPQLAKACNIYQRKERELVNASETVTTQRTYLRSVRG